MVNSENVTFEEVWAQLNPNQRRFVTQRRLYPSKKETAKAIGMVPGSVYQWPDIVDVAIELYERNTLQAAQMELQEAVAEAAQIKVREMREPGSTTKSQQKAAEEILDRVAGKATQKQVIDQNTTMQIEVEIVDGKD